MSVLFFDVDGTLLESGGAGARALERALREVAGVRGGLAGVRFDGATDLGLLRQALAAGGRAHSHELSLQVLERYAELLPAELTSSDRYRLLPGVPELLASLRAGGAALGLCTGNVAAGARAKLAHGGLWEHFSFGGFGSDAEAREDILAAGLQRAGEILGVPVDRSRTFVVGDTPKDVAAARAHGIRCLGVASGRWKAYELRDAGASFVAGSLAEPGIAELLLS